MGHHISLSDIVRSRRTAGAAEPIPERSGYRERHRHVEVVSLLSELSVCQLVDRCVVSVVKSGDAMPLVALIMHSAD